MPRKITPYEVLFLIPEQVETIALLRAGSGLDLSSYVARVFRSADAAHRYANRQPKNVRIVRVSRRVKVGDKIDPTERLRIL